MRGLNTILKSQSHVTVLRVLFKAKLPLSGRAVQRSSSLSNRATMMALESLVESRIVLREISSSSHSYTINRQNYFVAKILKQAFEAEELFWDDLGRTVRRLVRPRPIAAMATCPLARDEVDYGGRISLSMLFSTGRDRVKALSTLKKLAEVLISRHAMVLEHHMMDINTMDREEFIPLWRRVEREGILLFGSLP